MTLEGSVIEEPGLWAARDPRLRVPWPSVVPLSQRFESLMNLTPLNETAVARLSPPKPSMAKALNSTQWRANSKSCA